SHRDAHCVLGRGVRQDPGQTAVGRKKARLGYGSRNPQALDGPTSSNPLRNSFPYFSAASTARLAMTVTRCARYSALACMSLFRPSCLTLIFATDSGANFAARAFSMSAWRKTTGPAPVTATRTLPPKSATNTPTMAKREAWFLNFMYAARLGAWKETAV